MKEPSILEILRSRSHTEKQKEIAVEKFKWNHLPDWYRENEDNKRQMQEKIKELEK